MAGADYFVLHVAPDLFTYAHQYETVIGLSKL